VSVAEQGAPAGDGARRSDERQVLVERVVILVVVVVVLAELVRVGAGISGRELAASWQLLDRDILEHDLVRGIWYLHTQPRDAWTFEMDLRPYMETW